MRKIVACLGAATLLLMTASVMAQDTPSVPICYGWHSVTPNDPATVTGSISDAVPAQSWTFDAEPNTAITVRMEVTSGTLEPLVIVRDAAGAEIARAGANDPVGLRNVRVFSIPLEAGGAYTLIASRVGEADGSSAGDYRLMLEPGVSNTLPDAFIAGARHDALLYDGELVTGQFQAGNTTKIWYFAGEAGEPITAVVRAVNFSSLPNAGSMALYGFLDGEWTLMQDIPFNSPVEGVLSNLELTATTDYALVLRAVGGGFQGNTLNFGDLVEGELQASEGDRWTFFANAGDVVSARLESEAFDSFLELRDPIDVVVAQDDDGGGDRNSRIANFRIQGPGQYTLVARAFTAAEVGSPYTLTLDGIPAQTAISLGPVTNYELVVTGMDTARPALPPCSVALGADGDAVNPATCEPLDGLTALDLGDTAQIEGTIGANTPAQVYRLVVPAGTVVTFNMARTGGNLDPFLALTDASGNVLTRVSGATPQTADIVNFALTNAGCYFLYAGREGGVATTTTGTYTLTQFIPDLAGVAAPPPGITFAGVVTLEEAAKGKLPAIVGQTSDWQTVYRFRASEDGTYIAVAQRTSGNLIPALALFDTNGQPLQAVSANAFADTSNPLTFEAVANTDYFLVVRREDGATGGSAGDFTLTITAQDAAE